MSKVLIHLDASSQPVGVWRIVGDDEVESYYLPTVDKKWKTRGEQILEKENSTYEELFERLLSSSPYMDHFDITESENQEPLEAIMYRVSRDSPPE